LYERWKIPVIKVIFFLLFIVCLVSVKIAFFKPPVVHRVHIIKKTTGQREKKTNRKTLKTYKNHFYPRLFFFIDVKTFFKGLLRRFSLAFIVHIQTDSYVILSRHTTGYYYFFLILCFYSLTAIIIIIIISKIVNNTFYNKVLKLFCALC